MSYVNNACPVFIFCVQATMCIYFYAFSHVIIHLYHFAYLTVDITFVVEDIDQIKPLSEPFTLQVYCIFYIFRWYTQLNSNFSGLVKKKTFPNVVLKYKDYTVFMKKLIKFLLWNIVINIQHMQWQWPFYILTCLSQFTFFCRIYQRKERI